MEAAHNVELMRLLDFYGAMLTDRQHEMLRLRLEEDLSLSEIAEGSAYRARPSTMRCARRKRR